MNLPDRSSLKLQVLRGKITAFERVVVAFSGGVDSSLVASVAAWELGDNTVAVIAVSPSLSPRAHERARTVARYIGIQLIEQPTMEVDNEQYLKNTLARCYFCKHETYERLTPIAQIRSAVIVDGRNIDDIGDFRPGARAADEHGVKHPLFDANFMKDDIRRVAKKLGLPNWNDPAESCTSSRVLTGISISPTLLLSIQNVEAEVAELLPEGSTIRVRHLGENNARVEVGESNLTDAENRSADILAALASFGYSDVTVGLYQRGSMNKRNKNG